MRGNFQQDLLAFYQRELRYLREMGSEFARRYPKVAARLSLGPEEVPDPHVERLIESFAFLAGRVQLAIDSDFPLIPSTLLEILYPHLLAPIPGMAIARFDTDPEQGDLTGGFAVPRHSPLYTETLDRIVCRFRTCYPLVLWPLSVTQAGFESTARYDFLDDGRHAAVLHLQIAATGQQPIKALGCHRLRLFLNSDPVTASRLYELLAAGIGRVALLPDGRHDPVFLPASAVQPAGFAADEAVLPTPAHAHPAYRLVQEYFAFPRKFLFFDIEGLDRVPATRTLDVILALDTVPGERLAVSADTFLTGCTPIVNLFPRTTEPIRIDHTRHEYRMVADARFEQTTEIHSLTSVSASANPREDALRLSPFFSFRHGDAGPRAATGAGSGPGDEPRAWWFARRVATERADLPGTDMLVSFLDLDFTPAKPAQDILYAVALCTNRGLAERVPPGAILDLEGGAPVHRITCLSRPTPQVNPPLGGAALWRLVSHLSVNHLSLAGGRDGLSALREILRLYSFTEGPAVEQQIQGLVDLTTRPIVRRIGTDAWRGFVRGTEVSLTFDEANYVGSSPLLLAAVLDRFLALYGNLNSFTQVVAKTLQREGSWKTWPPMAGEQAVL